MLVKCRCSDLFPLQSAGSVKQEETVISLHVILVVLLSHYQHRAATNPLTKGASSEALYGGFNV